MLHVADSGIASIEAQMLEIRSSYQAAVNERVKNISAWVSGAISLEEYNASGLAIQAAADENAAARLRIMADPNYKKWLMRNAEPTLLAA